MGENLPKLVTLFLGTRIINRVISKFGFAILSHSISPLCIQTNPSFSALEKAKKKIFGEQSFYE
jgi:hypothetical protein